MGLEGGIGYRCVAGMKLRVKEIWIESIWGPWGETEIHEAWGEVYGYGVEAGDIGMEMCAGSIFGMNSG